MMFVLGLTQHLTDLADTRRNDLGLQLEEERLPKRVRHPSAKQNRQDRSHAPRPCRRRAVPYGTPELNGSALTRNKNPPVPYWDQGLVSGCGDRI